MKHHAPLPIKKPNFKIDEIVLIFLVAAIALAATVGGLASHTSPGPERPGKFLLIALTVTSPARVEDPGPPPAQAPLLAPAWTLPAE